MIYRTFIEMYASRPNNTPFVFEANDHGGVAGASRKYTVLCQPVDHHECFLKIDRGGSVEFTEGPLQITSIAWHACVVKDYFSSAVEYADAVAAMQYQSEYLSPPCICDLTGPNCWNGCTCGAVERGKYAAGASK